MGQDRAQTPLRLWPGAALVALQWFLWLALPMIAASQEALIVSAIGGLLTGVAVLAWWAFFSRAPKLDRWGGAAFIVVALAAAPAILHESIAGGMMGMMFFIYAVPPLCLALVVCAAFSRNLSTGPRRAAMVVTLLLACGGWGLLRTSGISGSGSADFRWRWSPTPEQRLLAQAAAAPAEAMLAEVAPPSLEPAAASLETPEATLEDPAPEVATPEEPIAAAATLQEAEGAEWPGFRGPARDGALRGVRIESDWAASPPVEMWRRAVGPGWSSFAVRGGRLYTQEQRGEDEIVACYDLATGAPVWQHRDAARFWEANAGAGPRATPTLHGGRVYAFGATGILNALDARDGSLVWSRDVSKDAGVSVPGWGFASSPLVVGDLVAVAAVGKLAAYDLETGTPRWFGPDGGHAYSSPHPATLGGVPQILLMSKAGAVSVAPADGAVLWEHAWPPHSRIVQPSVTLDGDLLISAGESNGLRRIAVAHGPGGWTAEERWTTFRLKPYFNDFVVHEGHAYGFDGAILACIDLTDGERKWKGGRYGQGQMLLLADQDMLLVLSEDGELALVGAKPDGFEELARAPGIEGKTWNHPVLAGDVLLVRNGEEMAAFRVKLRAPRSAQQQ